MNDLLIPFSTMCIQGTAMILLVFIARALLGRRVARTAFYIIWLLVVARLLVPVAIPVEKGPWLFLEQGACVVAERFQSHSTATATDASDQRAAATETPATSAAFSPHIGIPTTTTGERDAATAETPWAILTRIRLIGSTVLGACFAIAYGAALVRLKHVTRDRTAAWAPHVRSAGLHISRPVRVVENPRVASPFTYGVLFPVIVVPTSFEDQIDAPTARLVLKHELVHIRRFDALVKIILAATVCLYWFNPFVWALYVACSHDMELSCDELVTRRSPMSEKRTYTLALLDAASRRPQRCVGTAFSRGRLESRIEHVMRGVPTSALALAVSAALVATTAVICATTPDARASQQEVNPARAPEYSTVAPVLDAGTGTPGTVWEGTSIVTSPVEQMHGTSDLVSELAAPGQTLLVTPYYTVSLPDALTDAGIFWEYFEDGSPLASNGNFGTIVIRNQPGREIVALAFCTERDGLLHTMPLDTALSYRMVASMCIGSPEYDTLADATVLILADTADSLDTGQLPSFAETGSRSQVYGFAPGQASPSAYIASADFGAEGATIRTAGYSVLVPQATLDGDATCCYLGGLFDTGRFDELLLCTDQTRVSFYRATPDYVSAFLEETEVVVGTAADGTSLVASAYRLSADGTSAAGIDATPYAGWAHLA